MPAPSSPRAWLEYSLARHVDGGHEADTTLVAVAAAAPHGATDGAGSQPGYTGAVTDAAGGADVEPVTDGVGRSTTCTDGQ
ncbi:hypothetical protein [Aeoliella sp.]|uniref:hypothetical protein n=1 Tax=Aeoliella sp. TaxID=2795800 RepID=UPI003CCC1DB6